MCVYYACMYACVYVYGNNNSNSNTHSKHRTLNAATTWWFSLGALSLCARVSVQKETYYMAKRDLLYVKRGLVYVKRDPLTLAYLSLCASARSWQILTSMSLLRPRCSKSCTSAATRHAITSTVCSCLYHVCKMCMFVSYI
jgi:hypothetical protein